MESNMSERTERIRRMSNLLYVLCAVLTAVLLVFSVAAIVCGIMAPDNARLSELSAEYFGSVENAVIEYMFGAVSMLLMAVVSLMAGMMFRNMSRSYTPFLSANPSMLVMMGHITLFSAVAIPVIRYIVTVYMGTGPYSLDLVGVFMTITIAVIIYCASLIFEYGAELQKESDETL